jgi:hypothetical protein
MALIMAVVAVLTNDLSLMMAAFALLMAGP